VALLSLYTGALFGMILRAFGMAWTTVSIIAATLCLSGLVIVAVCRWARTEAIGAHLGGWFVLLFGAAPAILAAGGGYVVNRRATI
jgi:hypothetical protein